MQFSPQTFPSTLLPPPIEQPFPHSSLHTVVPQFRRLNCRLLTTAVRFCCQSGSGVGFLRVLLFPLSSLIPLTVPHSSSSIIRGWYNRPNSGRRIKWTHKGMVRSDISKPAMIFLFTARVHTTKSTVKILAAKSHCKYFLKIAEHCQYCNLPDPWRNFHP
jgi:hypothetical protein